MDLTNEQLLEIKKIIAEYKRIDVSMKSLLEQANLLSQQKQQIELDLATAREAEKFLIDKIKSETGETPNFFEIIRSINQLN